MDINRYNYEEFFLLYTDNELNAAEKEAVEQFAAAHLDLKEELELLQQFKATPDETGFPDIASLIRTEDNAFIHEGNAEEKFLLHTDNELSGEEKTLVEQFVHDHPARKEAFDLMHKAVLQPDLSVVFPNKQSLYRSEKEKVVSFTWWRMAAAAMVLLVAGALWLNRPEPGGSQTKVAVVDQPASSKKGLAASGEKPAQTQPAVDQPSDLPEAGAAIAGTPNEGSEKNEPESVVRRQPVTPVQKERPALSSTALAEKPVRRQRPVDEVAQVEAGNQPAFDKITPSVVNNQKSIIDEAVAMNTQADIAESADADSGISFASSNESDNVYVTNIPLDKKHALRGLLRKASRVINKAAGMNGEKSILIGSVELALK